MISLGDILPACLNALEGKKSESELQIPSAKRVVVFLVDGMGSENLRQNVELHPIASDILTTTGQTTLPSTTPVALATLGTGLYPGQHGFLGATFLVDENRTLLQPLKWKDQPNPKLIQPERTEFEAAIARYIDVFRVGPAAYTNSGLTQAVLRGGEYFAAENLFEIQQVAQKLLMKNYPALIYIYYRELDRIGHVNGVDSEKWRNELKSVLECISNLRNMLSDDDQLVITADHGMIDIDERIWIEDYPQIWSATKWLTGEPRFRHFYAEPSSLKVLEKELARITRFANIYSRDEFLDSGLVGQVESQFQSRIGDFVAIAKENVSLGSRTVDKRSSGLIGNHGGNSATERDIPISVLAR